MSYCDLEPATVYSVTEPRARKPYKCCECRAPILAGEKHLRCFMVFEGEAQSFRQHDSCARACEAVRDSIFDGEGCLPWGGLKEWWSDEGQHGDKTDQEYAKVRKLYAAVLRRERREPECSSPKLSYT